MINQKRDKENALFPKPVSPRLPIKPHKTSGACTFSCAIFQAFAISMAISVKASEASKGLGETYQTGSFPPGSRQSEKPDLLQWALMDAQKGTRLEHRAIPSSICTLTYA